MGKLRAARGEKASGFIAAGFKGKITKPNTDLGVAIHKNTKFSKIRIRRAVIKKRFKKSDNKMKRARRQEAFVRALKTAWY